MYLTKIHSLISVNNATLVTDYCEYLTLLYTLLIRVSFLTWTFDINVLISGNCLTSMYKRSFDIKCMPWWVFDQSMSVCDLIYNPADKLIMFIIQNYFCSLFIRVFMDLKHQDISSIFTDVCIVFFLTYFSTCMFLYYQH